MKILLGFVALCLSGNVLAILLKHGKCPDAKVMPDFDGSKFLGKWYMTAIIVAPWIKDTEKCRTVDVSQDENSNLQLIYTVICRLTGYQTTMLGLWRVYNFTEPAKMKIKWTGVDHEMDHWILGTDYDSYGVIYSCSTFRNSFYQWVYVLTKEQKPPKIVMKKVNEITKKVNINRSDFTMVKQDECVLYPDKKIAN